MSNTRLLWGIFKKIKNELGEKEVKNITPQTKLVFCGEHRIVFSSHPKLYLAIYHIRENSAVGIFFAVNPILLLSEDEKTGILQIKMEQIPVSEKKLMEIFHLIFEMLK